jgi:hypothetical protein
MPEGRHRVVVWSTGGIGSIAIGTIAGRPDLELVGVWVHSEGKVGKDASEPANGERVGVITTRDADELITLRPDCVVQAASGPERDALAITRLRQAPECRDLPLTVPRQAFSGV